ncbi:hypothetical protein [Brumimicrobium oceani]|uniref:Uncharacterized protein n=1 Tax=Brumimicrobium oceani TaxID=2100725 RepID=A0A2U2XFT7_9FLAO|nr:hypothetical protein [Brumimicrobium oceani]PWH86610.1 hypothetical protein DIT68_05080 [Brumimicrobium oceani]
MKKYCLLFLLPLFLFACLKPKSEFNLKKYEYAQGEALIYENLSKNNKNSKWTILNNAGDELQYFEGANPNIVTGITLPDGVYTVRLNSHRNKNRASSTVEKDFLLKSYKHSLRINNYPNSTMEKEYAIYVDNQLIGQSNYAGSFSAKIPEGLRLVKLVSATQTQEGLYDMIENVSISFYK